MDSPIKKLNLTGKENMPIGADPTKIYKDLTEQKVTLETAKTAGNDGVAPTIKPDEADEPLLQENPQRFVLFPIKYHEVSDASWTRKVVGGRT
jgi:ribonucleoside-diphosphate reductase subunit M2